MTYSLHRASLPKELIGSLTCIPNSADRICVHIKHIFCKLLYRHCVPWEGHPRGSIYFQSSLVCLSQHTLSCSSESGKTLKVTSTQQINSWFLKTHMIIYVYVWMNECTLYDTWDEMTYQTSPSIVTWSAERTEARQQRNLVVWDRNEVIGNDSSLK